jgi:YD repeat-containing protein
VTAASHFNVTEGVSGGPFSDATVASFNGTSSYLDVPNADENTTGPGSVGLWFKTTGSSEVLYSEQNKPLSAGSAGGLDPVLYVGADGRLLGQFWINNIGSVARSAAAVNDGKWHYAVLAAGTNSQSLYLDGVLQQTVSGTLSGAAQPYVAAGAGYLGGSWPDTSSSTVAVRWFTGDIAELAWYPAQLTAAQVAAQWDTSRYASGLIPVQTENVTDPGNNTVTSTYDLLNGGRVLSQTDANGSTTSYGYDTGGFQDETTLAGSYVTETGYDVRGNMVSRTTCQNQAANQCSTSYWSYYPDDTSASLSADPRNDMMLTYADGRSASATDTTYQTAYAYNAAGDLTGKTTPPVAGFPSGRTTSYAYTDGSTTAGGYSGAVPPKGLPYQVTTPGGAVTTTLYYADGDVAQVTDPDGQYTVYAYDGLGRKTSQTVYSDAYPYPNGLATTYTYDANGRLATQTDPAVTDRVTSDPHTAQTTTSYNADGNVTSQEVTDLTGQDASRTVTRTYNSYDQLASETDAANATTHYSYDSFGNVASKTDPDLNVTDYTYDGDGHLLTTSLENYTGSRATCQPSSGPLTVESRSYNPAGWLTFVDDAMCNQTGYTYYDNGLVATIGFGDPNGVNWFGTHWFSYDGAGNVIEDLTNNNATDTT